MPEPRGSRRLYQGSVVALDLEDWGAGYEHEIVRHLGAAAIVPVTPEGNVLLVKQHRPAIRDTLTEIPAGLLDVDGEDALTCATRELVEETGYRHASVEFLGGYYASAGFTDEYVHVFWGLTEPDASGPPEEGIQLVVKPLAEMIAAAHAGRVRDVKTAFGLMVLGAKPETLRAAGIEIG